MANGKRINKHKLAVTQAYCIIGLFVLFGAVVGFIIGRVSTPAKVETVTVTETVEVPVYEQGQLPAVKDVTYFDVPLSHSLQRYIYEVCADEGVPVTLIIAMIDHESRFNPEAVSTTNDYGLMQINAINHEWLEERYRTADMLDPYQNVFCGVKLIGRYITKYEDYGKALMAYNMGDYGARKAWEYNNATLLPGHGEKSVIMAMALLGGLTDEEVCCIRWHMGAFDSKENWNSYGRACTEYPTVLYTHTADMVAARIKGV